MRHEKWNDPADPPAKSGWYRVRLADGTERLAVFGPNVLKPGTSEWRDEATLEHLRPVGWREHTAAPAR